ncbi:MAG: helix-hairpin-helix domain-containing protein [bacterium]
MALLVAINLFCAQPDGEIGRVRLLVTANVECRIRPAPDFEAPGEPRRLLGGWRGLEQTIGVERAEPALLLDCGNYAAGSAEATATWGRAAVRYMNLAGYDGAAVGARDFTWGINNLEVLARLAGFPVLADPILDVLLNRRTPLFRPWVVRDVAGLRVALVALSVPVVSAGDAAAFVPGSPLEQLRRYLPAVVADTPDVIIALGSFPPAEGVLLLDSFPALALAVCPDDGGAASHDRLVPVPRMSQRLAVVDMLFDRKTRRLLQVNRRSVNVLPADRGSDGLERLIAEVAIPSEDSAGPFVSVELGRTETAAVLAEACRDRAAADVAILPLEVVGSGLAAGRPRRHELRAVAPFEDRLRVAQLDDTLLHALIRGRDPKLPAPMVAGADILVMPGADVGWPLGREVARLRPALRKPEWRVVTTERLLAASGITVPGRSVAVSLTGLWLEHAGRIDTLRAVALPRRTSAGPGFAPIEGLRGSVNINTADAAELERLPGIGPKTAARIIEYRSSIGAFRAVDDLGRVKGIGPKTLAKLLPLITIR